MKSTPGVDRFEGVGSWFWRQPMSHLCSTVVRCWGTRPLIVGSVCGAAVGTGVSFFGSGLGMAVLAMIAAFVVISLIHAYHPPGVALASIPVLLHPGHWFPLLVVLPFTVAAVGSTAAMSKWLRGWPVYPKSLRDCAR